MAWEVVCELLRDGKLDIQIKEEKENISAKSTSIKTAQKQELKNKGADTKRIEEIDLRLSKIASELTFIDNNRDKVAEYNKDKRELFEFQSRIRHA